jgi:hypothetical protein
MICFKKIWPSTINLIVKRFELDVVKETPPATKDTDASVAADKEGPSSDVKK